MDRMFRLKLNNQPKGRYSSLWFNANVNDHTISVGKLDNKKNREHCGDEDIEYSREREIFDAHKNYISYELSFRALVKGDEFEHDSWTVDIGKRKSITKEDLIKK